ncbi:receptor activity-modifying protein 2 isoform X2 [Engystomops pustulosus]|uniref:receptor activity-modifying protein 2 isoform X2 n=1 Tax=Engystomops pustulosus TaxID=76066 RepID=UPI003AFB3EC2
MESPILCMLTSALCLFTWAFGSMAVVENATQPTTYIQNEMNHGMIADLSHSTQYPILPTDMYEIFVEHCWTVFNRTMFQTESEHWCDWEHIFSIYSRFQICLEDCAENLQLPFPNELAHNTILGVHMYFFKDCDLLSEELMDPPENILLGLIFAPICIIPFLVSLVVYKSNTSKPQT